MKLSLALAHLAEYEDWNNKKRLSTKHCTVWCGVDHEYRFLCSCFGITAINGVPKVHNFQYSLTSLLNLTWMKSLYHAMCVTRGAHCHCMCILNKWQQQQVWGLMTILIKPISEIEPGVPS